MTRFTAGSHSGADPGLLIVHLYPDLLRSYGDRGNVLVLARRAEWRGISVRVVGITRGEPIPPGADLIVIGGGSDRVQALAGTDVVERRGVMADLVAGGTVVFGVCGGYQLLGHRYVGVDGGEVAGLGVLDVTTTAGPDRLVGRVSARASFGGQAFDVVGFENHAGRTTIGPAAAALASVPKGRGNDGRDRTEGAVQRNVVGTYLHGPVLPSSPGFADALLGRALARTRDHVELPPLDDRMEEAASLEALARGR